MAWMQKVLRIPPQLSALSCSVIPAHPWVPELGQHTKTGGYLSPLNAVSYLSNKLMEKGAGTHNIILLLCENTPAELLSSLDSVSSILPMPELRQVRRLAQSFSELEQVKMQLPDVVSALPEPITVATETTRQALNAARVEAAKLEADAAASVSSITTGLAGFLQERTAALADIASAMTELQGKTANAWFFNMKGPALTTAVELVKNLPHPDAVHTAAILFTGSDLSALEAMLG